MVITFRDEKAFINYQKTNPDEYNMLKSVIIQFLFNPENDRIVQTIILVGPEGAYAAYGTFGSYAAEISYDKKSLTINMNKEIYVFDSYDLLNKIDRIKNHKDFICCISLRNSYFSVNKNESAFSSEKDIFLTSRENDLMKNWVNHWFIYHCFDYEKLVTKYEYIYLRRDIAFIVAKIILYQYKPEIFDTPIEKNIEDKKIIFTGNTNEIDFKVTLDCITKLLCFDLDLMPTLTFYIPEFFTAIMDMLDYRKPIYNKDFIDFCPFVLSIYLVDLIKEKDLYDIEKKHLHIKYRDFDFYFDKVDGINVEMEVAPISVNHSWFQYCRRLLSNFFFWGQDYHKKYFTNQVLLQIPLLPDIGIEYEKSLASFTLMNSENEKQKK